MKAVAANFFYEVVWGEFLDLETHHTIWLIFLHLETDHEAPSGDDG